VQLVGRLANRRVHRSSATRSKSLPALLLAKYKDGDANVRSVWLCSRNDALGNAAVMLAAVAVWCTASAWPDLIVAAVMAGLFLWSSALILKQADGRITHCAPARGASRIVSTLTRAIRASPGIAQRCAVAGRTR
jgi:Co/Zn/Cd efflux system component